MSAFKMLIVDDDMQWTENTSSNLRIVPLIDLTGQNYDRLEIQHATNQQDGSRLIRENGTTGYDLIFLDLLYPTEPGGSLPEVELEDFQGMKWLPELRRLQPNATIMVITAYPYQNQLRNVVDAISRDFANDFVPKTSRFRDIQGRIRVAFAAQRRLRTMRKLEEAIHGLLRSRAASVLADDVGRLIERSNGELIHIAQIIESGDPSALLSAPDAVRALGRFLLDSYHDMTTFFACVGEQRPKIVNLTNTVSELLALCARRFEEVGAAMILPPEEKAVCVTTYESDIRIALHEALWNAADALRKSKTPVSIRKVELRVTADNVSRGAIVTVLDNAGGFDPEALPYIFEQRPPTGKNGSHQGIGLYIAKHMMQAIGGGIEARNHAEGGAEVILTVPDLAKA